MSTLHCPAEDCLIENQDKSDCLEYLCSNKCDFRSCPTRIREDHNCFVIVHCSPHRPTEVANYLLIGLVATMIVAIFFIGLYAGKKTSHLKHNVISLSKKRY